MRSLIACCGAFLFSVNAAAADGGMWVFPIARMCIGQDPGYAQTRFGQWIMQGGFNIKSSEFDKCVREKNWLPREMCDEVMSLDSEEAFSRSNLERLYNKYARVFRAFDVAGEYFLAFDSAEAKGTALPSCPQENAVRAPAARTGMFAAAS